VPGVLPDLVTTADGDPHRVMSVSDFDEKGLAFVPRAGRRV